MNFRKISILGVGLMGGSLALALKEKFPKIALWGYARNKSSYERLNRLNIVDLVSQSLEEVVRDSDLVILASPIRVILKHLEEIGCFLKKGAIVIDLGSVKKVVIDRAKKCLPKDVSFVGCHPLCGSEKKGALNANKDLYKNSLCIITSFNASSQIIKEFWESLGSKVYFLNPSLHDRILSDISHLPHILSFSLTELVSLKAMNLASGSFRDLTRISSSPPDVWVDIFIYNGKNIINSIQRYIKILRWFTQRIKESNEEELFSKIKKINKKIGKLGIPHYL
ncbi:MAG: prephenate dehydrogenase [Candidatus Omnitrophica bacterium]|nr:prephenate dehydrogenase [Candidatus Omnitrophota bacterium]MCM8825940.1 prephenate dehydrogenase [Candidatus Omnitrophota bacterium]